MNNIPEPSKHNPYKDADEDDEQLLRVDGISTMGDEQVLRLNEIPKSNTRPITPLKFNLKKKGINISPTVAALPR